MFSSSFKFFLVFVLCDFCVGSEDKVGVQEANQESGLDNKNILRILKELKEDVKEIKNDVREFKKEVKEELKELILNSLLSVCRPIY